MTQVETLYRWLGSDVRPATNEILAAALAHAERPYAARIATILLGRQHESAWAGLVANYERVPVELRQRIHARPELVRVGIAAAFKRGDGRGRQNALALLVDRPCPTLSYLVADALRDSRPPVREAAGKALRRCAEQVLIDAEQMAEAGQGFSAPAAGERAELARALHEALRTFELHRCLELLEACLWFAKDLGDNLWDALDGHRSRSGYLVAQHLKSWNHPRLAGFLLLALARPTWRRIAQELLAAWYEQAEVLALLRNSDLLADPDVQRSLHYLRRPRWFVTAIQALAQLPADARAQLPCWIGHLGFSGEERLRCLLRWQDSALPEVRRAATYALASLGGAQAAQALARVVAQRDSAAQFARWFLAGRRAAAAATRASSGQKRNRARPGNARTVNTAPR